MKRIRGIKTHRFDTGEFLNIGYCVPCPVHVMVTEDSNTYSATLYCDTICTTYHMFGMMKKSCTLDQFLEYVEGNMLPYIHDYEREILNAEG